LGGGRRPAAADTIAAMGIKPKSLSVALLALVALLGLPAAAQATLAYTRGLFKPVVYAAQDNGQGQRKLGPGRSPKVSPDGQLIAFEQEGKKDELKLAAANGSGVKTILTNLRSSFYVTFSPDSTTIAALRGAEIGKETLVLIDVASGAVRSVASGYFSGVSFSPDSGEIVYSRAASEKFPPRSDVFRVPVAGGAPVAITHDHKSLDPLWGPQNRIVLAKQAMIKGRMGVPKNDLYLIDPDGGGVKRLTRTRVTPLTEGLFPTQWSDSGNQLLTEYEGQDTSYAVTVNPRTGAERAIDKRNHGEQGFVGTAISGDGRTVLGWTGGFEPGPNHNVATAPYEGGRVKVLVKNASEPDWSR
jgi:Tol biopolymer transport system component